MLVLSFFFKKKNSFFTLLIFLYEEDFLIWSFNYYRFNFYLNRAWDGGVYRGSIEL